MGIDDGHGGISGKRKLGVGKGWIVTSRLLLEKTDGTDRRPWPYWDGLDTPGSGNGFCSAVEKKIGRFAPPAESVERKTG
jgi:hypothetical protein